MKNVLVAHVMGTILAILAGWYIPVFIYSGEYLLPAQLTFVTLACLWGIWTLVQIVRGKDELANRAAKHFAAKK